MDRSNHLPSPTTIACPTCGDGLSIFVCSMCGGEGKHVYINPPAVFVCPMCGGEGNRVFVVREQEQETQQQQQEQVEQEKHAVKPKPRIEGFARALLRGAKRWIYRYKPY